MTYRNTSIPNVFTMAFIKMKIVCFSMLYLLLIVLFLSLFISDLANKVALLDNGKWRIYFGVYVIMTGVATYVVSEWKGKVQAQQLITTRKIEEKDRGMHAQIWKVANAIAGVIFVIEGLLSLTSGIGTTIGWWPGREIFGSMPGILMIIFLLIFPLLVAPILAHILMAIRFANQR